MKIVSVNSQSAILKELGLRIKRNRLDMQLSQQDFAQKSGMQAFRQEPYLLPKTVMISGSEV